MYSNGEEVSEWRRQNTDACTKYALDYINTIVNEKLKQGGKKKQ